jgi:transketolase
MAVQVTQRPQAADAVKDLRLSGSIDQISINTIRTLSMDAVQKANSGHPGTPMALAPVAYCLWQRFLRYDPADPIWPNRDRFVLSNGHASMLLYSLLYLAGVKSVAAGGKILDEPAVSLDEIKRFRQIDSKTPGHPESHLTSGVETTTGPLGQGVGNSVGMAIAERWLASYFNKPGYPLCDYNVYAFCGDGDMMEGVSGESASLAGHLKLSNLCWMYDNNHITIEGKTDLAFSEDVATRFHGYGWNTTHVTDANDLDQFTKALDVFFATNDRPTLIIIDSHIAFGAPNRQDTKEAHGEALGEEEVRLTKRNYGWPEDAHFLVPDGVMENFANGIGKRGKELRTKWEALFEHYKKDYPALAEQFQQMQRRELPAGWDKDLPTFPADAKGLASRDSGAKVLNALAKNIPWVIGGAADLAPSTKTRLTFDGAGDFEAGYYCGRNFHFGIREHAMCSILNGMVLSKIRAFGAGFLIFSDYSRPPMRLASLMEIPVIYVFTHDSIGLGEDGPTHEPIEQLIGLRSVPGFIVLRPGDANEVTEAWKVIMQITNHPAALVLTRQAIPTFDRSKYAPAAGVAKGAYVLADARGATPELILMGTGSEVSLCVAAYEQLSAEGVRVRVVSMPSWEIFEQQTPEYRESVLPSKVTARISVEAGSTMGWSRYVGPAGKSIGMKSFGASAPGKDVFKKFGFTPENVIATAKDLLSTAKR